MTGQMLKTYYYLRNGMCRLPGGRRLHDTLLDALLHYNGRSRFPVRRITPNSGFYWRGYYDKLLFDPTDRFLLSHRSDFENRSPRIDDQIHVGMIDLDDRDHWIELGETVAWNWQQGCMLQWIPGTQATVVWNGLQHDRFVSHFLDVATMTQWTVPYPVYCISPDGRWALTTDFRRLADMRPGYGYAGISDPNRGVSAPDDSGIWKIDLARGDAKLLVSIAEIAAIPHHEPFPRDAKHWLNHLLYNPAGSRFVFLHRWAASEDATRFSTRMITASADGSDFHVIDPYGKTSHFDWRDTHNLLAWSWHPSYGERFLLLRDKTTEATVVGEQGMPVNGHPTFLPNSKEDWIINDTYPDSLRNQKLFLYNTKSEKEVPLGLYKSPPEYAGEWRCDLHPSASRDGLQISFDSVHEGLGRKTYIVQLEPRAFA